MHKITLWDGLTLIIKSDDWDFLCKHRFLTESPDIETIRAEFITGTGITKKKQQMWNMASVKFEEYIQDLREINGLDLNRMARERLSEQEKYGADE